MESAKKFQNQMDLVHSELGHDTFYQVVEDTLMSNNPKAVNHLAPSVMPIRKKFDPNYYKITSEWAGGYPRPMVEVTESLWDFSEAAKMIQGPQAKEIIQQNSRLTRPDIDLADLIYFKEVEYENELGKLLHDMKKYKRVAENLDYSKRKVNRENDRAEALRKIQEEEEDARRRKDEAALRRLERQRQQEEERKRQEEEEALRRAEEEEAYRQAEEEAKRLAEEEARAALEPILRYDSIVDQEKEYFRLKEIELNNLLEQQKEV